MTLKLAKPTGASLKLAKPTGAKLLMRTAWQPIDADAAAYIAAVETADGQTLEEKTKIAIDNFVLGCKADGIWSAIKASCILAGARTLTGALVPLVGAAPTNPSNVFVSGDYNRKTGLKGDASTKYLNSNRNCNADPQNSHHAAAYATDVGTTGYAMGAGGTGAGATNVGCPTLVFRNRATAAYQPGSPATSAGLVGVSRSNAADYVIRRNASNKTFVDASAAPVNQNLGIFSRIGTGLSSPTDARLAFYSIGESLDLAKLNARVTDLINAFGAAIP